MQYFTSYQPIIHGQPLQYVEYLQIFCMRSHELLYEGNKQQQKKCRPKEDAGESQLSSVPKNVKNGCVVVENGPFEVCGFRRVFM